MASEYFIQHGSECENVAAGVHFLAFKLLGSHVVQCSENGTLGCHRIGWKLGYGIRLIRFFQFCQTEIEQLHSSLRQHDVSWLQIAMDDAVLMRLVKRIRNLNPDLKTTRNGQRSVLQLLSQRLSFEIFHNKVINPVLLAYIENWTYMRMTQPGERLCLPFETGPQIKFVGKIFWKDFDSDETIEARVSRFIDLSHSSGADRRYDFIRAEFCS